MDIPLNRTEVIVSQTHTSLGYHDVGSQCQPGAYVDIAGQLYQVLERRHRYQFRGGCYQLHYVALYVQSAKLPDDRYCVNGQWMIGDPTCRYNAHSAILRCAVNPSGPCDRCPAYQGIAPSE